MSKALNPLDASWLLVESRETPMHVGGLIIFQLPDNAPEDFFLELMAEFRATRDFAPPWNQKLRSVSIRGVLPAWEETDEIDLEHHVRHAALPQPGGERELGQLIARLHSQPLDLNRPPWECSLIEGLENRRFAFYTKMHHSLIDGISGMKMLVRSMSTDAKESFKLPAFWSIGAGNASKPKKLKKKSSAKDAPSVLPTTAHAAAEAWSLVREQITSVPGVVRAFGTMLGGLASKKEKMKVPFDTPNSIFNGRIKGQRRFATQIYRIDRLRAVAQTAGATLNDVVLAICGGALRRFLLELDALPAKPLTTGIPVSVRPKDDEGTGNAITFIIGTLATDVEDPLERLRAITASTRLAKEHVQSLPRQAMMQYTMLLMAPYMVSLVAGVGGRTRPMFNITISNVPGPEQELYFRGAKMEATYPVSLVSHGQALNITCQSYGGKLAFGFTGCRDTLPHMQRIATYTGEALEELEQALAAAESAPPKPKKVTRLKRLRNAGSVAVKAKSAAAAKVRAKSTESGATKGRRGKAGAGKAVASKARATTASASKASASKASTSKASTSKASTSKASASKASASKASASKASASKASASKASASKASASKASTSKASTSKASASKASASKASASKASASKASASKASASKASASKASASKASASKASASNASAGKAGQTKTATTTGRRKVATLKPVKS